MTVSNTEIDDINLFAVVPEDKIIVDPGKNFIDKNVWNWRPEKQTHKRTTTNKKQKKKTLKLKEKEKKILEKEKEKERKTLGRKSKVLSIIEDDKPRKRSMTASSATLQSMYILKYSNFIVYDTFAKALNTKKKKKKKAKLAQRISEQKFSTKDT